MPQAVPLTTLTRKARSISERPAEVGGRAEIARWEIDTVMGNEHGRNSVVALVERAIGCLEMSKLARHSAADTVERTVKLIERQGGSVATITAESGTQLNSCKQIGETTGV